ncbi:MAG: phosphoribosylformylglycinamidine synthase subunit PurL, partial [Chloroflexi bacterium]|nr:phosphoribosylformylglycinamidine synthase subunit PurL [Chloroflexota bacterium]
MVERIIRVMVTPRPGEIAPGYLLSDIRALGIKGVNKVERRPLYFIRGSLDDAQIALLCGELLTDPIVQSYQTSAWDAALVQMPGMQRIEVGLLPGVTDTVAANLLQRAHLLGVNDMSAAATASSYLVYGEVSDEALHVIAQRLLCNDVIQYYTLGALEPHIGSANPAIQMRVDKVPLSGLSDSELLSLSRERLLSLDLAEMHAVQAYFHSEGREPTDVELESIAQTWSEHCVHKTFKGIVEYTETTAAGTTHTRVDSLIKTYLQAATLQINAPWVLSAFVDNAGIIAFDDQLEASFKVETHNHPSALEPFGGANTGVGGVVRDIIGVSARPIANTDVLCFGPLDTDPESLPAGVLHPRRIYNGVVGGVEDYGNKMGIPTVNGSILFEPGYTANPLVYCGCVGIAPRGLHVSQARPGDLAVLLGGRTGRDGLHGATFSSIELTDETGKTSGGAVQIGNPIVEKMVLDAVLVCRDQGLYTAINDCGAGGLSSAVSEMGEAVGVRVQLDSVPLKYQGLQPWEIWLSEAQERMVLAVPPEHEAAVRRICRDYSVEMTVIGAFGAGGRLILSYGAQQVADVDMAFLHKGIPRRTLKGEWSAPRGADLPDTIAGAALAEELLRILAHPNVRSKEDVVRKYDHEVQGGTLIKPFVGVHSDGPSDGAVLRPLEAVGGWRGLALGCGFNPAYGDIDPYAMAVAAIDEAVRNVVCVGADPKRVAILDNFCWGNPNLPDRMGSLVRACKGCYDGALLYGTPFISGKDSLNNEYLDGKSGQQVAIPPSLLISAIGLVPDVRRACSMDLKTAGNLLYIIGETRRELGGSYYYRLHGAVGTSVPAPTKNGPLTAQKVHQLISRGLIYACHDCSEGGLALALAEMSLAGELGLEVELGK